MIINETKPPFQILLKIITFSKPRGVLRFLRYLIFTTCRHENEIALMKGEDLTPNPIMRFEDGGFPDYIMCEVQNAGFAAPTPIQSQGFSISLQGHDFVGIAQTGSGKTLGYMLPAIIHCNHQPYLERGDGPIVLVLAPTR